MDAIAITYLGTNSRFRTVAQFAPEPLYIALSPERTDIADELDSAMSRLKLRDPDFATLLYDRYFGINTDQDPVFTEDEYAYLASAPTLRVAYDSYRAPLSYTDPATGAFAGAVALLFEDIAQITGLKFEFVAADCHDEAVRLVERGDADIVYDVDRESDPQAIKSLDTTGPYLRDPMALVAGPNPSGSRVALPSGFSLAASTAYSSYAEYDIVYCDTPKDCFDAVLEGKADIAFADTHVASA